MCIYIYIYIPLETFVSCASDGAIYKPHGVDESPKQAQLSFCPHRSTFVIFVVYFLPTYVGVNMIFGPKRFLVLNIFGMGELSAWGNLVSRHGGIVGWRP